MRVSLDDFGVDYSSLSYSRKFPFDRIKIDRSFVGTLGESPESMAIVRECGCTAVQGFYFGKPCLAAEVGRVIERLSAIRRVA